MIAWANRLGLRTSLAEHIGPLVISAGDNNSYMLGRIGKHNVAIAMPSPSLYGIVSTSQATDDVVRIFQDIGLALTVGVGSGALGSLHDVRAGDVVVGGSGRMASGLVEVDVSRDYPGPQFRRPEEFPSKFVDAPHSLLIGQSAKEHIQDILNENTVIRPDLSGSFQRLCIDADALRVKYR